MSLVGPPPAPSLAVQPPPPDLACGAVSARPRRAGPLPTPLSQPLSASSSAAVFPQEDREDAGVRSAPAPRFFFLSLLWDFTAGAGRGSEKRRARGRSAGFRCSAQTELGYCVPGVPSWSSLLRLGCDEGKPSAPASSPRRCLKERSGGSTAGVPLPAAPRDRSGEASRGRLPAPTLPKERSGDHRFPGAWHNSGASSWTGSRFPPSHWRLPARLHCL